jgi:putative ABC transport system substrate-binding protein
MTAFIGRRKFITLLGGAAAVWPLMAGAQQATMPVVGFLGNGTAASDTDRVMGFLKGLEETGYVEGRNVTVEYRWAENRQDRLPLLASELAALPVTVIVAAGGTASAFAAKGASRTISIVFAVGNDPVKFGLVASLNRPGGNLTGVSSLSNILLAKQIEILVEAFPRASNIALLVNVNNPNADADTSEAQRVAEVLLKQLLVVNATDDAELDLAFETLIRQGIGALVVESDPFFLSRRDKLISMSEHHAMPAIYDRPEWVSAGGLMSYGTSIKDTFRQVGAYTARLIQGEKPANLPVQQALKLQLALNLKTAAKLGIAFPSALLARADEVIE